MQKKQENFIPKIPLGGLFLVSMVCLAALCVPVTAADASIEAELGSVLNLHGTLFKGDRVYLFMTGPGLPSNGVTLTDISQRADQGHFTMVDVDSGQEWAYKWNTARIMNEIDPGTYIVYATNEPTDKAHLGGESTYKTLEVFLKQSVPAHGGSSVTNYNLNPEEHSTVIHAPTLALVTSTPTPVTTTPAPVLQPVTPMETTPVTKKSAFPLTSLFLALLGGLFLCLKNR